MPATLATQFAEALLEKLDPALGATGFKRRKRDYTYRREAGPVRHYVHLTIVKRGAVAQVSVDVAVRLHEIEQVLEHSPDRATVGVELGNWTGAGWRTWNLVTLEDVDVVQGALVNEIQRVGLPFLERFSSVREVHDVLAKGGAEAGLICPLRERWPELVRASEHILSGTA